MAHVAYEAVTFERDVWRAVVRGQLQSPDFNCSGAAVGFAKAVYEGKRCPQPAVPGPVKIADYLITVETLSYYDFPLMEHMRDNVTLQDYIMAWVDDEDGDVVWHTIPVSPENLAKYLSRDPDVAITLKEVILAATHLFKCRANTYVYSSILEGELIRPKDIPAEVMPGDDSYHHYSVYEARAQATRGDAGDNLQQVPNDSAPT